MGVVHHLQIAPKRSTTVKIEAIQSFISKLINEGHIENEYTIWTGETEVVKEVDHYSFKDWSVRSEANMLAQLEYVDASDLAYISEFKNCIFKIHLSRNSKLFGNLDIFQETNFQHFPVFILYFHTPIDYIIMRDFWGDEGHIYENVLLSDTNCVIVASGRNLESVYGLDKENDYLPFYNDVRELFGEYEIGVYY